MKKFITKWYPIILAFICLLYSVGYGLMGMTEEAHTQHIGQEQYYYLQ